MRQYSDMNPLRMASLEVVLVLNRLSNLDFLPEGSEILDVGAGEEAADVLAISGPDEGLAAELACRSRARLRPRAIEKKRGEETMRDKPL
jgi:hypothetical protein